MRKRKGKETTPIPGLSKTRTEESGKTPPPAPQKAALQWPSETTFSTDQQTIVEEVIVKAMFYGWEHEIQSAGIHFRPGLILVECKSPHTAEWHRVKVPELRNWQGVQLTTRKGDDIPKSLTAVQFLP
ncbi:protein of unknown function (DUF4780) [Popillia japonica]|uniref:DUF4780 domain-containing protein n=1 Tax=Popillia japonica TaxID=7064 RepID=A0AAW1IWH3_POPJA